MLAEVPSTIVGPTAGPTRGGRPLEVRVITLGQRSWWAEMAMQTSVASSAGIARRVARRIFRQKGLDPDDQTVDTIITILSELLSNVHKHTHDLCGTADIVFGRDNGVLAVAIHDQHPHRPRVLPESKPDGLSGRGLRLVHGLAINAGGRAVVLMDPDGGGWTVQAELPLSS
jgi:anti-sigma regulatory factor (Ser/Thr protein kinase)